MKQLPALELQVWHVFEFSKQPQLLDWYLKINVSWHVGHLRSYNSWHHSNVVTRNVE
jgi:hypothetical protein